MGGRRRTRVRQKTVHWGEINVSADEDVDGQALSKASTSKAKGKQKAVAKSSGVRISKKGKLGLITEMPLDVLYEVSPPFFLSAVGEPWG